ncbi:MAG: alanine--tRNA ligase [Cyclobacteriaceae bacterium]|nr:alanine--tRNA ligase [Cyclobacteriaceae bacterium]MCH8515462.1 alanine--tRNA ligase [Cyclobacteriaceae bacterium]
MSTTPKDSKAIRKTFLDFFESKGHKIVPSAPMVIKDDPTLMFTNAGMNQFKDFFLGNKKAVDTKVADTQKCLRVSGKHNDLEEVGHDTYHHTMFEMLGNWSFGDYFKKEAIDWAWELLTEKYGLEKDRLYVTVFEGDEGDGLPFDEEAAGYWKQHVAADRILNGNKKDNFWEMGDTGPCGPCSEIHIDLRSHAERSKQSGHELVNADHPQVVEIWNLVFIQFNRKGDGSLESLPDKHIDTGMGFERLCMAIQQKESTYDTDVFAPQIKHLESKSGAIYGKEEPKDIAIRVISDHIRTIVFAIADGQLPSNNKAGYVIRRILRRAVRYGYTFLDLKEPFLFEMTSLLSAQFEEIFPEVKAQQELIEKVIKEEEASFLRTLDTGLKLLGQHFEQAQSKEIAGDLAFELYDTFGFPIDLTQLIARENGFTVDEVGFTAAMQEQKNRSKAAAGSKQGDWIEVKQGESTFVGYDLLNRETQLLRYRKVEQKNKSFYQLVLEQTPFYPEGGGQVGDVGTLSFGEQKVAVWDTKKENDLILHFVNELPRATDARVVAMVNGEKRAASEANHTATHLLHAALRQVLGEHVQQKGSLVSPNALRFDFSHFSKVSAEELLQIERLVNAKIRQNVPLVEDRNIPIAEAQAKGAMALFGEKYGDTVRMITFDADYSVELCGGTHVGATGKIGAFCIVSESAVAAGVRRIEALSAEAAEEYLRAQKETLLEIKESLKQPKDVVQSVQQLQQQNQKLQKELERLQSEKAGAVKDQLIAKVRQQGELKVIISKISLPTADALKKLAFELRNEVEGLFAVLAVDIAGKPQIAVVMTDEVQQSKGFHAGKMVKDLAQHIQGGGGGQPFFATAGGKKLEGLDAAVKAAEELIAGE